METKKCPFCGRTVLAIAKVCKYCRQSFEPQQETIAAPLEAQSVAETPAVENEFWNDFDSSETTPDSYRQTQTNTAQNDKMSNLMWALCIIFPTFIGIIAIIVYLLKNRGDKAKSALIASAIGFVGWLLLGKLGIS